MAILNISPVETPEYDIEAFDSPIHLLQLKDDLARSRMREAFWISLIVHLLIAFVLAVSPRWLPSHAVLVPTAEEMLRERNATFLEMPKDLIQPKVRPNTDILSDKDRIAMAPGPANARFPEPRRVVMRPGPRPPAAARSPHPSVAKASPPPQPGPPQ